MSSLRILVAEDDPFISMMLVEMLEEMGHTVCASAQTQEETVKAALATRPDVMIVDVRLSMGSGIAAVEEILKSTFIPHIFATGDILTNCRRDPRAVVIQKPYRESDLARAVASALGRASTDEPSLLPEPRKTIGRGKGEG
ncbi:response regulator [Mesorhizobium sp.]|uniref:response regulator n=1 Tax=Mesorhizobium sp. TaxID=1871066 RepID=UPI003BA99E49